MLPKKGYQLECEKPLHRGEGQNGNFSVTYFLKDLLVTSYNRTFLHYKGKYLQNEQARREPARALGL